MHNNDRKALIYGLTIAIVLGIAFTALQAYEYSYLLYMGWEFGGDKFFSNCFMATGFHGAHVIIGTIFLAVPVLCRVHLGHCRIANARICG